MKAHNVTPTPAAPACQPDAVRIEEARMEAVNILLGLSSDDAGDEGSIFARAADKLSFWLAGRALRVEFKRRLWAALSASYGCNISDIDLIIARAGMLEQYIVTGSVSALSQFCRTDEVQQSLSGSLSKSPEKPATASAEGLTVFARDEEEASFHPEIGHFQTMESSLLEVVEGTTMDVAGGGSNATACTSRPPNTDGAA